MGGMQRADGGGGGIESRVGGELWLGCKNNNKINNNSSKPGFPTYAPASATPYCLSLAFFPHIA